MKIKILGVFFIICLMLILIPINVLGAEDNDIYKNGNITYQLFDDGTAKIISIEDDLLNGYIRIADILYNEEFYQITTIGANALNQLTEEHELEISYNVSPKLEDGNSFENISNIYIPIGAEGYTEENGWEEAKLKTYKITQQPQDVTVTAGDIKDTDVIEISARISALTAAASITYNWYFCDEEGNILEKANLESADLLGRAVYKIPKDLSYDNENNQARDYYLVCVVGEGYEGAIAEKSRIVKITVNPGTYKVYFNEGGLAEWSTGAIEGSIIVSVNSERKIENSSIPSIENLMPEGKGFTFAGWSLDEQNVVDVSTITFDKNTMLFPVWQYKVSFDACGGTFANGNSILEFIGTNFGFEIYDSIMDIENPTRNGFEFLGFFDEKEGGNSLEYYLDKDGIYEEKTFYAQWKESNHYYEIKEGNNQTWTGKGDLQFVVNANNSNFINMLFGLKTADNVSLLDEDIDFTIESNGTVTIKESFLNSLTDGEYQFILAYSDGETIAYVTVKHIDDSEENTNTVTNNTANNTANEGSNPQTGDNILLFVGVLVVSAMGFVATTKFRKN